MAHTTVPKADLGAVRMCRMPRARRRLVVRLFPHSRVSRLTELSLCSNTQIYASLGTLFPSPRKTVAAFTTFQFFQNIGSAAGFFFFAHVPVHGTRGTLIPLEILAGVGWLGALLFLLVRLQPVPDELDEANVGLINH